MSVGLGRGEVYSTEPRIVMRVMVRVQSIAAWVGVRCSTVKAQIFDG